jgi:proline iminopeptidase
MITVEDGTELHVGVTGEGPDVLVLTGGPGCVQYLEDDAIAPRGFRAWYPEPRGVGRSGGGAHTMEQALADLEAIRRDREVPRWVVLGHSWGSDLAVRYAVENPDAVTAVIGVAGRGPQRDRSWSAEYEAGQGSEPVVEIAWSREVHASLGESFSDWIHRPDLWRGLADCRTPMQFIAAGQDIRPSWPLQQLAALVPQGSFETVPGVPHDFWATHPQVWTETVTRACARATSDDARDRASRRRAAPSPARPAS